MSTATSLPGPHIDLVPELIRWFPPLALRRGERRRDGAADQRLRQALDEAEPDLAELRGDWRSEPGGRSHAGVARTFTPEPAAAPTRSRSRATSARAPGSRVPGGCPGGRPPISARTTRARSSTNGRSRTSSRSSGTRFSRRRSRPRCPSPSCRHASATSFPTGRPRSCPAESSTSTHRRSSTDPEALEPGRPLRSRSSSMPRRGSSRRATACGSRWPAPTGRTSGRRLPAER
jgi:hypothetical protein